MRTTLTLLKAIRAAAESFRVNPAFKTEEAITELATGEALISCLDEDGNVLKRVTSDDSGEIEDNENTTPDPSQGGTSSDPSQEGGSSGGSDGGGNDGGGNDDDGGADAN